MHSIYDGHPWPLDYPPWSRRRQIQLVWRFSHERLFQFPIRSRLHGSIVDHGTIATIGWRRRSPVDLRTSLRRAVLQINLRKLQKCCSKPYNRRFIARPKTSRNVLWDDLPSDWYSVWIYESIAPESPYESPLEIDWAPIHPNIHRGSFDRHERTAE